MRSSRGSQADYRQGSNNIREGHKPDVFVDSPALVANIVRGRVVRCSRLTRVLGIPTYLTPTYHLETSEKEKRAMFAREFYVIQYAHWIKDTRPLHGLVPVGIWVPYLLSVATATRPGAPVESSGAKGTNKALWYEHVDILEIRHPDNPSRTVMAVKVNLVHIKESAGKGRRYVTRPCLPRPDIISGNRKRVRLLRGADLGVLSRLPRRRAGPGSRCVQASFQVGARGVEPESSEALKRARMEICPSSSREQEERK